MTTPHPPGPYRDDAEIERIARQLLDWAAAIPVGTVTVSVHDRAVFLSGTVTWPFQRDAAGHAVCDIEGVSTVRNEIAVLRVSSVRSRVGPSDRPEWTQSAAVLRWAAQTASMWPRSSDR